MVAPVWLKLSPALALNNCSAQELMSTVLAVLFVKMKSKLQVPELAENVAVASQPDTGGVAVAPKSNVSAQAVPPQARARTRASGTGISTFLNALQKVTHRYSGGS